MSVLSVADRVRRLAIEMEEPEGDVVRKKRKTPKIKPPRRDPSTSNKSNREDYMQKYMKKYREDDGNDGKSYRKMPEKVKEFRRKQREKAKKVAGIHIDNEAEKWYQVFIKSSFGKKAYKDMEKKYPDYNNHQYKQATEFLFKAFVPWLEKMEKKFAKGGEFSEYKDEIAHLVKTKLRAGIT